MNRIPELDAQRPKLEKFVEQTAQHMGESAICLSIFTDNYKRGLDSLLQFALSIMLDKPIYLLVPHGVKIPENVKRVAVLIEFYDPQDPATMQAATQRLLHDAQSKGFTA